MAGCGSETVRIATVGDYHPFNFINDDGQIDGLERALGDELCARAALDCEWVTNDWEEMIPGLLAEEYDALITGMSITDERERVIDFTLAYYPPSPSIFLARAGSGDEAVDGRVGSTQNTIYSDYWNEQGVPYEPFETSQHAIDAILAGQIDTILVDHGFGVKAISEYAGRLIVVGPDVTLDKGLGIGVREGSELRAKFDEALASMKSDGTLNDLIRMWVGEDAATFAGTQ